jgi:hypothetical protein
MTGKRRRRKFRERQVKKKKNEPLFDYLFVKARLLASQKISIELAISWHYIVHVYYTHTPPRALYR